MESQFIYTQIMVCRPVTIQPSALGDPKQTDSAGSNSADGEAGQVSLEKTDAKTAAPSLNVSSHEPSKSWKRPDIYGPRGLMET